MSYGISGNIVREFLARPECADMPTLTLAKWIYEQEPIQFSNVEHIRSLIRGYRGSLGPINRRKLVAKDFFNQNELVKKSL